MKTIMATLLVFVASVFPVMALDSVATNSDFVHRIEAIGTLSDSDLKSLLSEASAESRRRETHLVKQLEKGLPLKSKIAVVFLLGLYRTPEAAEPLSRIITLKNPEDDLPARESLVDRYPAVFALVRIGYPSIAPMIRNLETSTDENVLKLSGRVLFHLCGQDTARVLVERRLKEDMPEESRNRLRENQKYIARIH